MDYTEQTSTGAVAQAREAIKEARDEHGEANTSLDIPSNQSEVDAGESPQEFADTALDEHTVEHSPESPQDTNADAAYTRSVAFSVSKDVEFDRSVEEQAEEAKERLGEIQMVNQELERQGNKRRYVMSENDAPESAHVHKDDFGHYYYKTVEIEITPSDVAKYSGVGAFAVLDEDTRAVKTIEFLSDMYSDPLVDANTKEAAMSWLDRHLTLPGDDAAKSTDMFDHSFKEKLANLIAGASAKSSEGEEGKAGRREEKTPEGVPDGAQHAQDPSQVPEGADTYEGPSGGLYYVPEGGGGQDGGQADIESPWTAGQDFAEQVYEDVQDADDPYAAVHEQALDYAQEQGLGEEEAYNLAEAAEERVGELFIDEQEGEQPGRAADEPDPWS